MSRSIYLDYNASAPVAPEARAAMAPFLEHAFGNPSSIHRHGQRARAAIERARESVARLAGSVDPSAVVFTSGATEAINLALRGAAVAHPGLGILMSAVEHTAVGATVEALSAERTVGVLEVDADGRIDLARLDAALTAPAIVAVMAANNETGVIQDVAEVAARVHRHGGLLLVDAAQAAGRVPVAMEEWGADMVALSGHKLGGPQGSGALVVAPGVTIASILTGGPQERTLRGGTENVAAIVGFGAAAVLAVDRREARAAAMREARDRLEAGILRSVEGARVLAAGAPRLPNTSAVLLPGADAETLVFALDLEGVCVSTGSACATGSTEPSHVLVAMGVPEAELRSCVRLSTGPETTPEEIDRVVALLPRVVARVRAAR